MIAGIFHEGSGLGDQLMRYITVRTLALDKGYEWGMYEVFNFKGHDFLSSMGFTIENTLTSTFHLGPWNKFQEKDIRDASGVDIRSYDPEINFVEDNTIIDGGFEDEKYWGHLLNKIREWLKVEPLEMPDDLCIIGFRGGEYYSDTDLGLPKEYYDEAISLMRKKYPDIRFEVHTDDPALAKQFFPDFECIHDIGLNWRSVRYAKHLIIANSAFYIMPSLLNEDAKEIIAPRYWARRNTHTWARPACYYKDRRFMYI